MKRLIRYLVLMAVIMIGVPCMAAPVSKQTYMINGKTVTCNVVIKNNTSYIALKDLYSVLGLYSHVNFSPSGETSGRLAIGKSKEALKEYCYDISYEVFANNKVDFDGSIFTGGNNQALMKCLPFEQNGEFYVPLKAIAQAYNMNLTYVKTASAVKQTAKNIQITKSNMDSFFNMTYGQLSKAYGPNYRTVNLEGAIGIVFNGTDIIFSFGTDEKPSNNDKVFSMILGNGKQSSLCGLKMGMSVQNVKKILGKPLTETEDDTLGDGSILLVYETGGHRLYLDIYDGVLTYAHLKKTND